MAAEAGNTTLVVYPCSVCSETFGDIHSSCAKHVNGRGKCKEKGAIVVPVPINFSRNDRQIGGRIGHLLGPGALASAPSLADSSGMERADGLRRRRRHPSQVSNLSFLLIPIIPIILQTYLPYLSQLSQLSSIFFLTYPLHAYVADK
jgi:hypothetical protein